MIPTNIVLSERNILRDTARRYRERGYSVVEKPTSRDLPKALHGFQPDLIAEKDSDFVVVEVKSAGKVRRTDYWQQLRTSIQNQPNGRLEIVVNNAPDVEALSVEEVINLLAQSKRVLEVSSPQVALLSSWAALEASMLVVLDRYQVALPDYKTDTLLASLQVEGLISDEDYEFIRNIRVRRNAIAHGMRVSISEAEVETLTQIATTMLDPDE